MPTQTSIKQKAQKTRCSCEVRMMTNNKEMLPRAMAVLRTLAALIMSCELIPVLKSMEPAIMAHMKHPNISPNGGSVSIPA